MSALEESVSTLEAAIDHACKTLDKAAKQIESLTTQNAYFRKHYEEAKARTAYPEFCKHPGKCAGTGRCMAEWVCND